MLSSLCWLCCHCADCHYAHKWDRWQLDCSHRNILTVPIPSSKCSSRSVICRYQGSTQSGCSDKKMQSVQWATYSIYKQAPSELGLCCMTAKPRGCSLTLLHSLHYTSNTTLSTLHSLHYTLYTTLLTLHSLLLSSHSLLLTLHSLPLTLHSLLLTLHSLLLTLHSLLLTLHSRALSQQFVSLVMAILIAIPCQVRRV